MSRNCTLYIDQNFWPGEVKPCDENTWLKAQTCASVRLSRGSSSKYASIILPDSFDDTTVYNISCYSNFTAIRNSTGQPNTVDESKSYTVRYYVPEKASPSSSDFDHNSIIETTYYLGASSYIVKRDTTPYFQATPTNITVHEGDLAVLKCHIGNLGPKMVNVVVWRKIGQDVPLTIGEMRFSPEATEFTIDHSRMSSSSSTWDLLIKNVQSKHAGVYECQVTANHRIAQNVNLNVLERSKLRSDLRMNGTQYVDIGNSIHLTCNATGDGRTQVDVDWFFEGNRVHPSNPRWRGRLEILRRRYDDSIYISELIIDRSTMADKGSYVCRSSDLLVSSLKVHVLKDGDQKSIKKGGVIASKVRKEVFSKSSSKDNPDRRDTPDERRKGEIKLHNSAQRTSSIVLHHILTFIVILCLAR